VTPRRRSLLVGSGSLACAVCIALSVVFAVNDALLIIAATAAAIGAVVAWRLRRRWPAPLLAALLIGASVGLSRGGIAGSADDPLLAAQGSTVAIAGTVTEARGISWIVEVDTVATRSGLRPIHDSILLDNLHTIVLQPGDAITATVKLARPGLAPGATSVDALERIGVDVIATATDVQVVKHTWTVARVLSNMRNAMSAATARVMPPPYSSLLLGIVFGIHQTLPADIVTSLQRSGLYHIVAVSGLKVVIALGLLRALVQRLEWSRRRHLVVALLFVCFYVSISGAGAAAVRSSVLALVALVIQRDGRRVVPLVLLAAMAAGFLLLEPREVFDAGFQLSYLGTAGILLWADAIARRIPGPAWLAEPFAITVAAQLATTPVMAGTFGVVSVVGPPVNAVVLPLIPVLMLAGALTTLLAFVAPVLASALAIPVAWMIAAVVALARGASALPLAAFTVGQWPVAWVAAELVAATALFLLWRSRPAALPQHTGTSRHQKLTACITAAALGAVVMLVLSQPDGRFHVTVLDVGAYPATLVQAPDGALALVDGGSSAGKLDAALGRVLSPATHRLDLVVLTAGSSSHIGALSGLQQHYEIGAAVAVAQRTAAATKTMVGFQVAGADVVDAQGASWSWHRVTWQSFDLGDGTAVVRISDGDAAALLLGTTGTNTQDDLLASRTNQLRADLLVAPPGGAVETSLLESVRPGFIAAPSVAGAVALSGAWAREIARTSLDGDLRYTAGSSGLAPG
jgi:ComEC/Rec2-related protein